MSHSKSQLFTLIGRRIVLHKEYCDCTEGMIVEKIGPARYGCHLQRADGTLYILGTGRPATVDFRRDEFKLPPLPRQERKPPRLSDESEGFAYADVPDF